MTDAIDPPRIAIPYFTGNGHTKRLAEAVADGAGGAQLVDVEQINAEGWAILDGAEAIIFAAPTYMGSTAARFDQFLEDASERWTDMEWKDKLAAGITVATFPSGDKLSSLMRLAVYAAQMGMIWVGQGEIGAPVRPENGPRNAQGSWLGLMAVSSRDKSQLVDPDDLETARLFGARIAAATLRWRA